MAWLTLGIALVLVLVIPVAFVDSFVSAFRRRCSLPRTEQPTTWQLIGMALRRLRRKG